MEVDPVAAEMTPTAVEPMRIPRRQNAASHCSHYLHISDLTEE
jgi:hypothetical protein